MRPARQPGGWAGLSALPSCSSLLPALSVRCRTRSIRSGMLRRGRAACGRLSGASFFPSVCSRRRVHAARFARPVRARYGFGRRRHEHSWTAGVACRDNYRHSELSDLGYDLHRDIQVRAFCSGNVACSRHGGGLFTAILFAAGRFALAWYLAREAEASAYGAATALVLLLIWI